MSDSRFPGGSEAPDDISAPLSRSWSGSSVGTAAAATATTAMELTRHIKLAIATFLIVVMGVLGHMSLGGFDVVTSLYVIMQIITTIGYGDITPKTPELKFCVAIFIILVLILIAYAVNLLTDWIMSASAAELEEKVFRHEDHGHGEAVSAKRSPFVKLSFAASLFFLSVAAGTVFFRFAEHCSCSYDFTWVDNASCPEWPADVDFATCEASGGQVKTWIDAFYMSVVTVTTVGFGDFTPQSKQGRAFGVVWMFVGVASTGFFISSLSDFLFTSGEEELHPEDALSIDRSLFDRIDKDGKGTLSRSEYIEFVLVKHGLVTQDVMNLLNSKFDSFDFDQCGGVTWAEMCRARRKMTHDAHLKD